MALVDLRIDVWEVVQRHNARIVDHNIDPAEVFHRSGDDGLSPLRVGNAVRAGDRLTAKRGDLTNHGLRRTGIRAEPLHVATDVVDNDPGPAAGKQHRVRSPHPATATRHHRDTSIEPEFGHHNPPNTTSR